MNKSVVEQILVKLGVEIRSGHDLTSRTAKDPGTMGMYRILTPKCIYTFDACTDDIRDYVLAHEFGHMLSHITCGNYFVKLSKHIVSPCGNYVLNIDYADAVWLHKLSIEEEAKADMFACLFLGMLNLPRCETFDARNAGYVFILPFHVRLRILHEATQMLNFIKQILNEEMIVNEEAA